MHPTDPVSTVNYIRFIDTVQQSRGRAEMNYSNALRIKAYSSSMYEQINGTPNLYIVLLSTRA